MARSVWDGLAHPISARRGAIAEVYREAYGVRPAVWLRDNGLLGPDTVLAHAAWLDEEEIEALGSTRTAVAHCPMSNQYVPYGVMPMRRLLESGATVALGDGWFDLRPPPRTLFENMKMLVLMLGWPIWDPGASSAGEALHLATRGGAAALGLDSGRLEPGALADVIAVDLHRPHLTPVHDPLAALVYAARASDVVLNIVGGRIIVEEGRCTEVDQDEVMAEAKARSLAT